ncbi:Methyl-accepting chemotaxis protein [Paramagnetospirillum magnetotacticum MS-1]|uniref:Methyl-accepting chemotaxis protein n=1 Tax=Paramagnetospirillum magnetotacticum MS-1 TaxID=272627 RepID=A0A0C2V5G3_PARME|nr:methyl-accepting chemotaxis protein [Paramagnetospirillum magnetotacticum]KIM00312.1 Methyl-accepting chemotaxis protein [Paramagnetospirillum magnetotacticum MS-1]
MFDNLRLGIKLMLAMGAAIVVVASMLTISNLRAMEDVIGQAERAELEGHYKAVSDRILLQSRMAESLAAFTASLPMVQDKFATGDRAALTAILQPGWTAMALGFGAEQFQFHTPPATSFLRLHKPEKFGDDLSSFRKTVLLANEARKATRGLEGGVAGLGIRGVAPVGNRGHHVGTVEFGLTFGQGFFDAFKAERNVDIAMYLMDGGKAVTFASTMGKIPMFDEASLAKAFAGAPQIMHISVQDGPRAVYAAEVADFSGTRIGVIELSMDRSRYVASLASARDTALLVAGLALALGLGLALSAARHLTSRIGRLSESVERVANGDLAQPVIGGGGDEIGQLALAVESMRARLHNLVGEVRSHALAAIESIHEIDGAVEGQAATSSEMSASVAEITSTMEELSASSTQISEHSKSVVEIANQTWEQSKRGSEAMDMVLSKMADIQNDNSNSLSEILELGTRSKEISKVMSIINTIADQTKLIAFNAALEAASAGEAGRRFGVVAAEIRRLADSVTDSTGEIETKVNQIQDSISRLIITSEKGGASISDGMAATGNTAELLGGMVDAARQTTSAAQQISLSTQQQKTASSQVVVALREIVTASSHTAQSLARIRAVSHDMTRLSGELGEKVGSFSLETSKA